MKVVVGLGNPGSEYARTRHNVGFEVLDEVARRWQAPAPKQKFQSEFAEIMVGNERVLLVAPQTYMNLSGQAVSQLVKFYQLSPADLLIICDDMNLPVGKLRFRSQGSAGGQKGLKHIIESLGTEEIPRLRVGIGRPPGQMGTVDFVLSRFRKDELDTHHDALLRAASGVEVWIRDGMEPAMNQFNGAEPSADNP